MKYARSASASATAPILATEGESRFPTYRFSTPLAGWRVVYRVEVVLGVLDFRPIDFQPIAFRPEVVLGVLDLAPDGRFRTLSRFPGTRFSTLHSIFDPAPVCLVLDFRP